jgi:adenine-specific DNA-methyltransferase
MEEIEKRNKELLEEIEKLKRQIKALKSKKKYGLVWEEEKEPEHIVLECQTKIPILKELKEKRIVIDEEKPMNILIEGDNYHALTVLNYTHKGKIDLIYIDPPYNTGKANEWKYNDKWIDQNDAYKHSKWLNFMSIRLKLAKELLSERGMIFISIDDNEFAQLKLLCDSVFGEENFIAVFPRKSGIAPRIDAKHISVEHDYVICYAKNSALVKFNKVSMAEDDSYKYEDEFVEIRGRYKLNKLDRGSIHYSENLVYPIEAPDGTLIWPGGEKGKPNWTWRWSKEKIKWGIENKYIVFKRTNNKWSVYFKQYQFVDNNGKPIERSIPYKSLILDFPNELGNQELESIFHERVFDYPKPVGLIKYLIKLCENKNATILDFFAGSGTTGQAVLELNKEDGGNRQFILCTNDENNICTEVCYPRIVKVMNGYKKPNGKEVEKLGGNLIYFETKLIDIDHITHISDEQKIKLTYEAGEMISLREGTFEEVEKNEWWQIFKNKTKYTVIYFKEDKSRLNELVKKLSKLKEKVVLYIFSWGKNEYKNEFTEYKNIRVEDIPEPIIDVYKEVNKL